ncbi:MAG: peptidylprolyl isomerase [Terrimesophilobacter sp.]
MARSKNAEREAREARERLRRFNARQGTHASQLRRRKRDNILAIVGAIVIAALAGVTQVVYFSAGPGAPQPVPSVSPTPPAEPTSGKNVGDVPDPSLSENRTWTGTLTLNDVTLGIELDGAKAPQTVAVFVGEVEDDYFIGKTCHRLTLPPTRLIQCGSLDGTGAGDPAFGFGPIENAPTDTVYPAGTIAMARAGNDAYSQGRQFFIMLDDGTLPNDAAGGYTVFGSVTSGLDALISSVADAGTANESPDGPPAVPTTITGVTLQ